MLGLSIEVWVPSSGDELMRVLISGHGDYIAGAPVQRLQAAGHEIVAMEVRPTREAGRGS
jgi:nucleoside-diphosphate-sugar epimerase